MEGTAERIIRLCHAYTQLSEKYQKLDVEHMTLRSKVVPLIRLLQVYKQTIEQLNQDKQTLEKNLQEASYKHEALKSFEILLQPELGEALSEAEEQMELINATLQEVESNSDLDFSEIDKVLLRRKSNFIEDSQTTYNLTTRFGAEHGKPDEDSHQKESVEGVVIAQASMEFDRSRYPLRGTVVKYIEPTEPVAQNDWAAIQ